MDQTLERSCSIERIVALFREVHDSLRQPVELDVLIGQPSFDAVQLEGNNGLHIFFLQRNEREDLIETVEKLGTEMAPQARLDNF